MPDPEPTPTPSPNSDPPLVTSYWEQPERIDTATDGSTSITKSFKGDYAALVEYASTLEVGTSEESGLKLRSMTLTRTVGKAPANLATLRLEYGEEKSDDSAKTATETSNNWSMRHIQRIVSLMRRTGQSASMPGRGNLEAWKHEPNPELYDSFQYRNSIGALFTLSLEEQKVARKIMSGVEGAMRFYPTVQRVRTYTHGRISGVGENLAFIDTPGSPWDSAAASWLKVGDDVTLDGKTGVQTRTESWIGAASWDVDLYGTVAQGRWTELDAG